MSGEDERHEECTKGGSGSHHPELEGSDLEDFFIDGEERDGPSQKDGEEVEGDGREEDVLTSEEADSLKEGGERISPVLASGFDDFDSSQENEEDEGGEAFEGVDEGVAALHANHCSCCGGSGDGGELETSAVPGDGIGECGAGNNEGHERGFGGLLNGSCGSVEKEAEIHPLNGPAEPGDGHQSEGTGRDDGHGNLDDAFAGEGVGHLPGGEREQEHREELDESDVSGREIGFLDPTGFLDAGEDLVSDGSGLHLHSEDGDEAAGEEAAVVRETEGCVGIVVCVGRLHWRRSCFR